jgi:hypothetical protein
MSAIACFRQLTSFADDGHIYTMCRLPLFLFLLVIVSDGVAQNAPRLRLNRADLTVLGVTIGVTSRAQVEAALGTAAQFKIGLGEAADDAVCYRSSLKNDDTVVVFYFGALGGWTDVTQISVSQGEPASIRVAHCAASRTVSRNLKFLKGLSLGMSSADVRQMLGPPSRAKKSQLSYYVSHNCTSGKVNGAKEDFNPCEVVDSVEATFAPLDKLTCVTFYHFIDK